MKLEDYDFNLPNDLIAQYPASKRDRSRLLVLDRAKSSIQHYLFKDIINFLGPSDLLVINQTRVVKARLRGVRVGTGAEVELLLIRQEGGYWLAMGRPGRRLSPGTRVALAGGALHALIIGRAPRGRFLVDFEGEDVASVLEAAGEVPLPPYIERQPREEDSCRYQTVFAQHAGAIAAPTAGLHFTLPLLGEIESQGAKVVPLVLHVGPGTFEPVRTGDPRQHRLEPEYFEVSEESAAALCRCRQQGGRIIAVGTTVVRALETIAAGNGEFRATCGWTDKFIYPPYDFRAVDALVTNFHLPQSTLLLLVAAFAGREKTLDAYNTAVAEGYRFYSYGDAMLLL